MKKSFVTHIRVHTHTSTHPMSKRKGGDDNDEPHAKKAKLIVFTPTEALIRYFRDPAVDGLLRRFLTADSLGMCVHAYTCDVRHFWCVVVVLDVLAQLVFHHANRVLDDQPEYGYTDFAFFSIAVFLSAGESKVGNNLCWTPSTTP